MLCDGKGMQITPGFVLNQDVFIKVAGLSITASIIFKQWATNSEIIV